MIRYFAFTSLFAVQLASAAVIPAGAVPTAGLYRVDMDSTMTAKGPPNASTVDRQRLDGASGTNTRTVTVDGHAPVTLQHPGGAPVTQCIPVRAAGDASAALPAMAGCRSTVPVIGPDGVTASSVCNGMTVKSTIKRLDAVTWQYTVLTTQPAAPTAAMMAGGMPILRMGLQQATQKGTPAERAAAVKQLAEYDQSMGQMAKEAAESEAADKATGTVAPTGPLVETRMVKRMTRIADTCK